MTIIVYSLISVAMFYLGSRAVITSPIWKRYPAKLASFFDCPACTGFWWGVVLHLTVGYRYDLNYLGLADHDLISSLLVGLCSIVMTPIVAGLMQLGFEWLGSVQPPSTE